jgi:hypothetical protein
MKLTHYIIFGLLFLFSLETFSQEIEIKVKGHVERYGQKLEGVTVRLLRNGKEEKRIVTKSNGKYQFMLVEPNSKYLLEFTKDYHIPIKIQISTENPPKKELVEGEFTIPIGIIERFPEMDVSFLEDPIAIIKYNPEIKTFGFDEKHLQEVKTKLLNAQNTAQMLHQKGMKPMEKAEQAKQETTKENLDSEKKEPENTAKQKEEDKLKNEAEERARKEEAERKAKELTQAAKKKESPVVNQEKSQHSMETDAAKALKNKEEKEAEAKKNQAIKTAYENELLTSMAENQRKSREIDFIREKSEAEASALLERYRKEGELKTYYTPLLISDKEKNKEIEANRLSKQLFISSLSETVAAQNKELKQKEVALEGPKPIYIVLSERREETLFSNSIITEALIKNERVRIKKETMIWGTENFYLNDKAISVEEYRNIFEKLKKN